MYSVIYPPKFYAKVSQTQRYVNAQSFQWWGPGASEVATYLIGLPCVNNSRFSLPKNSPGSNVTYCLKSSAICNGRVPF
jgi:hypothetical protein